jgi:SOS-response transcriptional repressor LexA
MRGLQYNVGGGFWVTNQLGRKLRELRGKMSLREAAHKTGISHAYLDRLEKGIDPRTGKEIYPSVFTLKTLSKAYNVSYSELFKAAGYITENLTDDEEELMSKMAEDEHAIKALEKFFDNHPEFENLSDDEIRLLPDLAEIMRPLTSDKKIIPYTVDDSKHKTESDNGSIEIPVLGSIRAGTPIEMIIESAPDYERVERELIHGYDAFVLRVQGDSMIGEQIYDGDRVVVIYTPDFFPTDVCVVSINGEEATLKKVKQQDDICMLIPSNPEMEPMIYPSSEVHVIGVVVEVRHRRRRGHHNDYRPHHRA